MEVQDKIKLFVDECMIKDENSVVATNEIYNRYTYGYANVFQLRYRVMM